MKKFKKAFRRLPDPRADNARHDLLEVLFIALAAMLCGAESCSDMADFGQSKEELLRLFLRLEHGIPTPEWLFPEWLGPGEIAILDHALVATPHVVHQDVDRVGLADDQVERRFHLDVESMVAADAGDLLIEKLMIRR